MTELKVSTPNVLYAMRYYVLLLLLLAAVGLKIFHHLDVEMREHNFNALEHGFLDVQHSVLKKNIASVVKDFLVLKGHQSQGGHHQYDQQDYLHMLGSEFELLCQTREFYQRIELLDAKGKGLIAVDCAGGHDQTEHLQEPSARDYVRAGFMLNPDQIYISRLNLDVEERTQHPERGSDLHFVSPIVNHSNEALGVLVITYHTEGALEVQSSLADLNALITPQGGNMLLVNEQGVTFNTLPISLQKAGLGVFDLSAQLPDVWSHIASESRGSIHSPYGYINFLNIDPQAAVSEALLFVTGNTIASPDQRWVLMTITPSASVDFGLQSFLHRALLIVLPLFLITLVIIFWLLRSRLLREAIQNSYTTQAQLIESIMGSMRDVVIGLDDRMRVQFVNNAVEDLLGFKTEQLQGQSVCKFIQGLREGSDIQQWMERLIEQKAEQHEVQACTAEGETIPVELSLSHAPANKNTLYILVLRDITERRQAEQQQESLHLKYYHREKMAEIGLLVGGIMHEVANPMAAIQGLLLDFQETDRLKDKPALSEDEDQRISLMVEHVDRVKAIGREVSNFLRPQSTSMELTDLNGLIRTTTSLVGFDRRWGQIHHCNELSPQLPPIEAIGDQLVQVILNLLVNAADSCNERCDIARPNGCAMTCAGCELEAKILVTTQLQDQWVLMQIIDNGVGMDEATQKHVFDSFYTTKEEGKGTGLGMSLCQSIIAEHNGRIEISTQPGEGCTVSVYLPLEQNSVPDDGLVPHVLITEKTLHESA